MNHFCRSLLIFLHLHFHELLMKIKFLIGRGVKHIWYIKMRLLFINYFTPLWYDIPWKVYTVPRDKFLIYLKLVFIQLGIFWLLTTTCIENWKPFVIFFNFFFTLANCLSVLGFSGNQFFNLKSFICILDPFSSCAHQKFRFFC